jgi:hypothetical protein
LSSRLQIKIHETVILPVVLYGYETLSLKLREERRLRVLTRIFGCRRSEIPGDWRNLHHEELHKLYSSPNVIRMVK